MGFLPDHYATSWVKAGRLTAIAPDRLNLTSIFYLVRNAKYRLSPVAEVLWNSIIEAGRPSLTEKIHQP